MKHFSGVSRSVTDLYKYMNESTDEMQHEHLKHQPRLHSAGLEPVPADMEVRGGVVHADSTQQFKPCCDCGDCANTAGGLIIYTT